MPNALGVPEDRELSPFTGWTRDHLAAHADHLLDSLRPYATPAYARIELPGRASYSGFDSDAFEGFARSFMLAAFRIAGERGVGPVAEDLIARYSSGLAAGADALHPEAWPRIAQGRPTQPMVEAASVALALHETRPWLWDKLDARTQGLVADWLGEFVGNQTWPNNWMLFQTVVEEFLASIGAPHEEREILRGLEKADDWYVGDGWYTDGAGRNFDYYIAWAMHLYPLLWTRMAAGGPRATLAVEKREVYRDRLRRFLFWHQHFIGADGGPVHQGRSLTYRFAAAAPFWMGEMFDCSPYEPGLARRAASGVVKHFAERGAPDERGLLTLGWYGEHLPMTQPYSGPASPYWAGKGFVGLMLPAEHPVWSAQEAALPVETGDFAVAVWPVGWLLAGTRRDGIVRLLNHGSDHALVGNDPQDHDTARFQKDDPHYSPFAFSTATAPDAEASAWTRNVGNHLALISPDGALTTRRGVILPLGAGDGWAASRHLPKVASGPDGLLESVDGADVESQSFFADGRETRVHRVTAPAGWTVREGGYPVADAKPLQLVEDGVRSGLISSGIRGLNGWTGSGVDTAEGANAYGEHSATPYLTAVHPGGTCHYVSVVTLEGRQGMEALGGETR